MRAPFSELQSALFKEANFARSPVLVGRRDLNTSRRIVFEGYRQPVGASADSLKYAFQLAARAVKTYTGDQKGSVEFNYIESQGSLRPVDYLDAWIMYDSNSFQRSFRAYVDNGRVRLDVLQEDGKNVATTLRSTLKESYHSMNDILSGRFPELMAKEIMPGTERFLMLPAQRSF